MRVVEITPKRKTLDLKQWSKRTAHESDYSTLIKNDTLIKDDKGNPLLLYLKLDWDFTDLRDRLQRMEFQASERTGGLKTTSRVFGYQPRIALRRDFCTATSLASSDPQSNNLLCDFGRKIDPLYRTFFPEVAGAHHAQTIKVLPEWRIPGTVFTSGIVNKNNPLKYHFDAGNFKDVCSCMLGLRRDILGGYLAVPELDLGFEIGDGSLLIFDGQSLLHGVTPIHRINTKAYRFTVVYYALKGMWQCKTVGEEVQRIREVRTARERKRSGLATSVAPKVGEEIYVDQNAGVHAPTKKP